MTDAQCQPVDRNAKRQLIDRIRLYERHAKQLRRQLCTLERNTLGPQILREYDDLLRVEVQRWQALSLKDRGDEEDRPTDVDPASVALYASNWIGPIAVERRVGNQPVPCICTDACWYSGHPERVWSSSILMYRLKGFGHYWICDVCYDNEDYEQFGLRF